MWMLLASVSLLAVPIFLIASVVSAIRKTGRWKRYLAYSGAFFVLLFVSSIQIEQTIGTKPTSSTDPTQQPKAQEQQAAQNKQEQKEAGQTGKPAAIQQATETKNESVPTENKPKAENKPAEKIIPGLTATDIKLNLEKHGFEFTGPRPMTSSDGYFDEGKATDLATGVDYSVTINALSPSQVRAVTFRADGTLAAGSVSRSKILSVAKEYLGYCATVPYDGANPQQARKWVESNITKVKQGKPVETVIGNAKLVLAGEEYFYFLQIFPKDGG